MPNLGPLITSRSDNNSLFAVANADVPGKQADIAYGLTWNVVAGTSFLGAVIPVPGLEQGTPLSCTLQPSGSTSALITDAYNCWLIAAYAFGNQIQVYIYAGGTGTNGQPANNAAFGVSWAVVGDPTP